MGWEAIAAFVGTGLALILALTSWWRDDGKDATDKAVVSAERAARMEAKIDSVLENTKSLKEDFRLHEDHDNNRFGEVFKLIREGHA